MVNCHSEWNEESLALNKRDPSHSFRMTKECYMFIIDFDDTLFDTHAFKEVRQKTLSSIGISDEIYKKSYHEAYNNSFGVNTYSNDRHAEVLTAYGFDKQAVLSALDGLNILLKNLLFPDTIYFLEWLKKLNQKLILLSLGESSWQKMKIDNTGIREYFVKVFTIDDTKEHVIEKILEEFAKEKEVWFINDKIDETRKVIERFPHLKPILKMSPKFTEEEYKLSLMPYFSTLTQIKEYAEQQIR